MSGRQDGEPPQYAGDQPLAVDAGEHCHRCGRPYNDVWWCDDNALWVDVYEWAGGDRAHAQLGGGLLCPTCFDAGREIQRLSALLVQAREALAFYADEANWAARVIYTAPEYMTRYAGEVSLMESGPANDGGDRARSALAALTGEQQSSGEKTSKEQG